MRNESPTPKYELDSSDDFLLAVLQGLGDRPKFIPPKFFYDAQGSQLFDLICSTPEYYPTRTEMLILEKYGGEMAQHIGLSSVLVELGSGSATKTPLLLRHLNDDAAYVPIDICKPHLIQSTARLSELFSNIRMHPLCADYTQLPSVKMDGYEDCRRAVFFPGSSIGNLTPHESVKLLKHAAHLVGRNGAMLIGVDSKKPHHILNAAYNDASGYTAAFNLNLLARMQRELDARLDAKNFEHYAFYNSNLGRIEMHLVSRKKQHVSIAGSTFNFADGESIHTENSYKYTAQEFQQLARLAGWYPEKLWSDPDGLFNVHYLSLSSGTPQ